MLSLAGGELILVISSGMVPKLPVHPLYTHLRSGVPYEGQTVGVHLGSSDSVAELTGGFPLPHAGTGDECN